MTFIPDRNLHNAEHDIIPDRNLHNAEHDSVPDDCHQWDSPNRPDSHSQHVGRVHITLQLFVVEYNYPHCEPLEDILLHKCFRFFRYYTLGIHSLPKGVYLIDWLRNIKGASQKKLQL